MYQYVVVSIFFWFKNVQTSLIFLFLCLITILQDEKKLKSDWLENFQTKTNIKPQHNVCRGLNVSFVS